MSWVENLLKQRIIKRYSNAFKRHVVHQVEQGHLSTAQTKRRFDEAGTDNLVTLTLFISKPLQGYKVLYHQKNQYFPPSVFIEPKRLPARSFCPAYSATPMTPVTPATPRESSSGTSSVLFTTLRVLGFVALVLMLASIVYAGWIALENWGSIRV